MQSPSPITLRLFVALMVLIGGVLGANYWFSVPLVQNNVFGIELNTNRQVLDIVYDFADRIYFDAEANVDAAIQSHEQRLRSIVELTANHIKTMRDQNNFLQQRSADMSAIFEEVRNFKLNNDDYIWIADYNGKFLAHPLESLHQKTVTKEPESEESVIFKIIDEVRAKGDGVFRYKWQRLTKPDVTDKYSYVKDYPEWGVVIGSGIYLEDVQKQTEAGKARALEEIAQVIKDIRIANNGYLYLFNSDGQMLFHPNPNIHGKDFTEQLNPVTGIPIYVELIAAADTGSELFYKWDRPNDPGNYIYEKYSLVRHFSAFDWYIASSVYLDDLKASSVQLKQRLIAIGFFALLVSIIAAFLFAESITSPIRRLSQTAFKISRGALNTKTDIRRNDELGVLAESIDQMVDKLRDNIYTLNTRVEQRTQELSTSNQQLQITVERLQRTQLEMQQVEQRQRLILNALPAQIAYLDGNERFIFANKAYHEIFAHTAESIVGKSLREVTGERMYNDIEPYILQALNGNIVHYEYQLDGETLPQHPHRNIPPMLTRRTVIPFIGDDGEIVALLNLSIDITKEREAEAQLAQASKMRAVGQMSGGVAHDFNNLLTVIIGNMLQVEELGELTNDQQRSLHTAIRASRRGAELIKRLLTFSRKQPFSPVLTNAAQLIQEAQQLINGSLPEHTKLNLKVSEHLHNVFTDPAQFEDALVNVILNASHAMPQGGEITLVAQNCAAQNESLLRFDANIPEGDYVYLSVQDQGDGFSQSALQFAFEPFFTTKDAGVGSGLGLSMVYGFVKQAEGYIRISNNEYGALVEILIPASQEHIPLAQTVVTDHITPASRPLFILLVDDNEELRELVVKQLVDMGHSVIEAENADEAIQLLQGGLPNLDGVITDAVMPGPFTGLDVIATTKARYPNCFTLLMTGYTNQLNELEGQVEILTKPFEKQTLANVIRKVSNNK